MRPLALLFLLVLGFAPALALAQQAPSAEDLERLAETIAALQARLEQAAEWRGGVERELKEAEQALATLTQNIAALETALELEAETLAELERRGAGLEAARARQQEAVAGYLRGAYVTGRQEYLKLLLNQEEVDASARVLRYYQYFAAARARKIAEYQATLDALAGNRADVALSLNRLQEQRGQLALRRGELEAGQARRLALLGELDVTLAEGGGELERLRREQREMEALLEELQRSIADLPLGDQQQPFAAMKGKLPWPNEGRLLNRFGQRLELGDLSWQGVTLAAPEGSEVRAVHHGRVVFADWFAGSGLLLIIDHGDGYMSLYAHNQRLYREVGDWVSSGEAIAAAGSTGGRRESGVYFEIRHAGRPQDPAAWCQARR